MAQWNAKVSMKGPTGLTGPTGTQGPQGPQGFTGPTGTRGPQGFVGARGAQGAQGFAGPQGLTGTAISDIFFGTGTTGPYYINTNNSGIFYNSTTTELYSRNFTFTSQSGIPLLGTNRISISQTGSTIMVGPTNEYVYITSNTGQTWVQQTSLGISLWCTAVSWDGSVMYAAANGAPQKMYRSLNAGSTWAEIQPIVRSWGGLATSCNGSVVLASARNNVVPTSVILYVSQDYGSNWRSTNYVDGSLYQRAPGLAMSSNGDIMYAGFLDMNTLYRSYNYGSNWTQVTTSYTWLNLACSGDGRYVVGHPFGTSFLIYSSNFASNFANVAVNTVWRDITISEDGSQMIAASPNNYLSKSTNYGVTWVPIATTQSLAWNATAISKDGRLIAAANGNDTVNGNVFINIQWAFQGILQGPTGNEPGPISLQGSYTGDYVYWNGSQWTVGSDTVRIGRSNGVIGQATNAIAVGFQAGYSNQSTNTVAIGNGAGYSNQGEYSIAIGFQAGYTNQKASSIVINATSSAINPSNSSLYVKPVRSQATATGLNQLWYNSTTKEIFFYSP